MTPDILKKLTRELDAGIKTEVQVVYLLAGIRKLIERDEIKEEYADLNFHCDWALHSKLDRATAKEILKKFDAAHALLRGQIKLRDLPPPLSTEIERISKMSSFEKELSRFLAEYDLPPLTKNRPDGWSYFLHLYAKVIEDIPLMVALPAEKKKKSKTATTDSAPKHISHVTINFAEAREMIEHSTGEKEVLFKVTWTIHDKNGQGRGDISVFYSFQATT